MINVSGAVLKSVKTMADRSIVVTVDFGELVKLGDFEDIIQMPIRIIIAPEEDIQSLNNPDSE